MVHIIIFQEDKKHEEKKIYKTGSNNVAPGCI